jgi:hypothetical protein
MINFKNCADRQATLKLEYTDREGRPRLRDIGVEDLVLAVESLPEVEALQILDASVAALTDRYTERVTMTSPATEDDLRSLSKRNVALLEAVSSLEEVMSALLEERNTLRKTLSVVQEHCSLQLEDIRAMRRRLTKGNQ